MNKIKTKPQVVYLRMKKSLRDRLADLATHYDRHGSLNAYLTLRLEQIAEIDEERLAEAYTHLEQVAEAENTKKNEVDHE